MAEDSPIEEMTLVDPGPGEVGEAPPKGEARRGRSHEEPLPYPGLRAFRADETDIFWGRQAALDTMADRLARTRFLAVVGPSGCGKSSLVKTGLYTTLRRGLLPNAGGRWRIAECSPGRGPIRNLARALLKARSDDPDAEPDREALDLIDALLRRGPRSVIEYADGGLLDEGRNLLIMVDQFEELFRFGSYAGREEAEAFGRLLLESARSSLPIRVVITMRSEYIGACSLIPGLAEQISEGTFLTPRMTREECRQAIEGPAGARAFDIEPELVARILNDLQAFASFDRADDLGQAEQLALQADQLPLMQHLLNRIWRQAQAQAQAGYRPGRPILTLQDYDDAKGLNGALDAHGDEILARLEAEAGPEIAPTVERVFRALVEGPSLSLAVRRPRQFGDLVEAAGGEEKRDAVAKVVEAFRGPDCNFLRTSGRALIDKMMVDIGHESLIRRWSKLRDWFAAEGDARDQWNRLSQEAALWKLGTIDPPRDLRLRRFTDWWSSEQPSPYLAARYGGDFANVTAFLDASKKAEQRRKRSKMLVRIGVLLIALALIAYLFGTNVQLKQAKAEALRSQLDTQLSLERERALTNDRAKATFVIQDYVGRNDCRRYPRPSPAYDRCVNDKVGYLYERYDADQPILKQLELQAPASGPAGGGVR